MSEKNRSKPQEASRRDFIKASAGTALGSALPALAIPMVHAQGSDMLKAALIGCGGRGRGAAEDNLKAASATGVYVKFVAVADAFENKAKDAANALNKRSGDITPERTFSGLDAYQKAIDSDINLVVTAAAPGFRPQHFEAAIKAGKHVFMEKPVCVDAPGFRKVMAAAKMADEKKRKVVVGLQRHHESGYQGGIQAIADGLYGDITMLRAYWNGGGIWNRKREPNQTEMQFQVNNWYHFNWLSGDHICEQHVHNLDIANWVMSAALKKEGENWAHPVKANGMGALWHRGYGDFIRTKKGNNKGQIFDAHFVEFTYENGITLLSQCRHQPNCWSSVSEYFHSTKSPNGGHNLGGRGVSGAGPGPKLQDGNGYVQEHMDLLTAIKEDKPRNEAYYGAISSMTAVFGRMATYSGVEVKWDDAVKSGPDTFATNLAWDAQPPVMPDADGNYPIPVPGEYKPYDMPGGRKK
jgi:myo-inositol 2-dehydrogenase/D-chiro-inositol 1-dehydrogenase